MPGRSSLPGIGSVEKTDKKNTWHIRVSLGKNPVTGKYRKSPSRTVHGTKSGAAKALMEHRAELMDPSRHKAERHNRQGLRRPVPRGARNGHGAPSGSSPCSPQTLLVPALPPAARRVVRLTAKTYPQVRMFGRVCNSTYGFCPVLLGRGRFVFHLDSNCLVRFHFMFATCHHAAFS